MRQLVAIVTDVGDLVSHDQVVLGADHRLQVVANEARAAAAGGRRPRITIGQGDLSVVGSLELFTDVVQSLNLLLDLGDLV
ncbi:hypothetical protein [Aquincola sp. J276]|uniref:hypothetical protein n=1 Tax=Aquincola sp. J276 TaxID=2898432 RepID=UPI0021507540|nr:hypothetical protein [Aquincola sp. J276]MCR5868224.1 hypothetical protein [Aquincola sp. J276]